uniref:Uncharacterized protein n=1 Tax=Peronospora matthiolae TaxID=2874970 RepID=A0AAV1TAS6_9STRA
MLEAEGSSSLDSAAGDSSPAVAIQQQAVPVVNSPRGASPSATDTSTACAAGAANRNPDESEIELINSIESDDASDSKKTTRDSGTTGEDTARGRLTGSGERGGIVSKIFEPSDSSDESSSHASLPETRGDGKNVPYNHHERSNSRYRGVTGVSDHAGITQEARAEIPCTTLLKWSLLGCRHPRSWTGWPA